VSRVTARPAEAFAKTKEAASKVRTFLKGATIDARDVQMTRTILELAVTGFGEKREVLGHRAKVGFLVTLRALDHLEPILVGIVDAGAHAIDGVRFETTELKQLRAKARRGAVVAAREKAELYADAAGVALGKVQHIEDVNPDSMKYRGHGANADADGFDAESGTVSVGAMTVSAAVMMAFGIIG